VRTTGPCSESRSRAQPGSWGAPRWNPGCAAGLVVPALPRPSEQRDVEDVARPSTAGSLRSGQPSVS
jgi:hypothetical protein